MITKERLQELKETVNWEDYINAYEVNKTYGSNGIKIQSKYKDINELDIDDLFNLDDPSSQYCMFDFELNLKKTGDLITCLLKGKSFSYYYNKRGSNIEIKFEFDTSTNILTRHFIHLDKNQDNIEQYYLNDVYIMAIIKFLWQRGKDRQNRDANNSKSITSKAQESESQDINNIFMTIIKPKYDESIAYRIDLLKINGKELTYYEYKDIVWNLYEEFKKGTITNLLNQNKLNYNEEVKKEITSLIFNYHKQLIEKFEEGTN